ncbi:hypothetical protein ACFW4O_26335 [Streptomyces mutabilis]|uniref:hypothetical protein n=1 Tax=Streptomyces mutabilis TaxID=67332 RepID=UPI0036B6DC8A
MAWRADADTFAESAGQSASFQSTPDGGHRQRAARYAGVLTRAGQRRSLAA